MAQIQKIHPKLPMPFTVAIPKEPNTDTAEQYVGNVNAFAVSFGDVLADLRKMAKLPIKTLDRLTQGN